MSTRDALHAPLERRKIAEQIADTLKEAIVGGKLSPGESLPSERDLAEKYSVNRSSIREALLRLEAWGLVEIRQGGATRVRDFLMSAGLNLLPHLLGVGKKPEPRMLRDVHEIRTMLLGWCAERAALKADPASVARLEGLARRLAEPGAKPRELQELDYDFFDELVAITGNRVLALLSNVVREVYMGGRDRFAAMYAKGVFDPAHHKRAVQAIRKRDPEGARQAMQAHAQSALNTVEYTP